MGAYSRLGANSRLGAFSNKYGILRFKNDSSSDSSPSIQNKYDSRVFKM